MSKDPARALRGQILRDGIVHFKQKATGWE